MDASVIIPARNAAATLGATFAALAAQRTAARFEVILVDDGSTDDTVAIAEAAPVTVRVVPGAAEGPATARNRGAAVATGTLLAFTDADCEPAPEWIGALVAAGRDADLVQGRVLPPPGLEFGPFDRYISVQAEYGLYETANLAVRREVFERLGGFESILVPRGSKELGEDVWLGWRVRRSGGRTTFCPDALVYHAVFARGPGGFVAEQARLRFFPELARRIPELRDRFFYRRLFLSRRSALFDLAAVGAAGVLATRRPTLALLAAPYANELRRDARRWPGHDPLLVVAAGLARDAVGAGALLLGSLRSRTPLF